MVENEVGSEVERRVVSMGVRRVMDVRRNRVGRRKDLEDKYLCMFANNILL
jgi:hypothetical protein